MSQLKIHITNMCCRYSRCFFLWRSLEVCGITNALAGLSGVNSDAAVVAGASSESKFHSRGPNKVLEPIQEVSVPQGSACNLLPC